MTTSHNKLGLLLGFIGMCLFAGTLPATRLAQLYPSRAEYLERYRADADATIKAGFVLPADRAALLAFARPSRVAS